MKNLRQFFRRINPVHAVPLIPDETGLQLWRERIYQSMMAAMLFWGLVALIPSVWLSIKNEFYWIGLFDIVAYGLAAALFFLRDRIPYPIRATGFIIIGLILGIVVLFATGDGGAGLFWIFAVPPLASLLLGLSGGLIFSGVVFLIMVAIGVLISLDIEFLQGINEYSVGYWTVYAANFLAANAIVTVPLGALLNGLVHSAAKAQEVQSFSDAVLTASTVGILVYEADSGQCVRANPAAYALIGAADKALIQQNFRQIASWGPSGLLEEAERTLETDEPRQFDTQFTTTFGQGVYLHCEFSSVLFGGKRHLLLTISDTSEINQAKTAVEHRLAELEAIRTLSIEMRTAARLDEILPILLDTTLKVLQCTTGSIWLYHPSEDLLRIQEARGYGPPGNEIAIPPEKPGQGLAGYVYATGEPHMSKEFNQEPRIPEEVRIRIPGGIGGISVPIRAEQKVIGVFVVNTTQPHEAGVDEFNLLITLAEIAGNAIHRAQLFEQTESQLQRLMALAEIDRAISSNLDIRLTLETLVGQVVTQLRVDAADVLLMNQESRVLEFGAGRGFYDPTFGINKTLRVGAGYAGQVAAERQRMFISELNLREDNPSLYEEAQDEGFVSYLAVPLIAKSELKGVLEIFHRSKLDPEHDWLDFLDTLAGQASIAIDNATLFDDLQRSTLELEQAYEATIEGWARALELRDEETEGHTRRVTDLTLELARKLGVKEDRLADVRRGALLHDIGKMGIPDGILLKPGPLTDEEWVQMKKHPAYANEMLSSIQYLQDSLEIPYAHHEKWDGSGYPRGLGGVGIPDSARIFAVADVFDALTSDRPYRKAWSKAKAIGYIREQSGKHFEPRVVDAFLALKQSA